MLEEENKKEKNINLLLIFDFFVWYNNSVLKEYKFTKFHYSKE